MKNAWRQPGVRNSASSQTVPTERKKITPAESVNLVTTIHTPPGSHELAVLALASMGWEYRRIVFAADSAVIAEGVSRL